MGSATDPKAPGSGATAADLTPTAPAARLSGSQESAISGAVPAGALISSSTLRISGTELLGSPLGASQRPGYVPGIAQTNVSIQVSKMTADPPSSHERTPSPSGVNADELEDAVREVLATGAVSVAFQPIFDMGRRRVFAYEALARPEHPAFKGNPAVLFSAAAKLNLAGQLGRMVRDKASLLAPNVPLFFNVHPSELNAPYIIRPDDPVFTHTDGVYLEVTEQVPLTQYAMCKPVLTELGARGVNLVVDDLGAGYSNLKYIADLSPKMVKIDRELIIGLQVGSRLFRLVTQIVEMCHALGAEVVVEGIETEDEYKAVRDTGATYAQGYFVARPMKGTLPPISMEVRQVAPRKI
jgi:EAL domain-containing protein (putative c-di-GMP-specific phosphodiesterase class I)